MNTNRTQSGSISKLWSVGAGLLFMTFLATTASAAMSELYIDKLPVPGTTSVSNYLTTAQSGVLLENDQVTLKWQSDGNLVMSYCNKRILWTSNTKNNGTILAFQKSDGKLVIKNSSGNVVWSTTGTTANMLQLQWDHDLVMLDGSGKQIWSAGTAYEQLSDDATRHSISYSESIREYFIPPDCPYKYLYLHAEGADGGKRRVEETWGAVRFQVAAGSGATIIGIFEIGTGPNMIPPGSSVRVMVGQKGYTEIDQSTVGCFGGGGTGIMFRKPQDTYWHLLLVAGGGGGAYADCCSVKRQGRSAETGEDGGTGGGDKWAGGQNGGDGTEYLDLLQHLCDNCGGMGINSIGWADKITINGPHDYAVTGLPGQESDWERIGSGPGGEADIGGGGGGGFSGGGAGKNYYPGGGGGSFVNSDLAVAEFRKKNDPTIETGDGFVEYQFGNDFFLPIRMDKYTGTCLTDANAQTNNGASILVAGCNSSTAQSWFLQDMTVHYGGDLGKCLDLPLSDTYVGNGIQLYDCNGTKAQVWIYDGISKNIRSGLDMSKCFHAADGSNPNMSNNRVTLWDCTNVDNMRWAISGATTPVISPSKNRILYAENTKKCIDVSHSQTANGTNIQLYDCNNSDAQNWYFDGSAIRLNMDHNKCLDLSQSKTDNGNNIQVFDCNDTNAQKWTYNGIAQSFHSWVDSEKCIDVSQSSTANGTNIQIWDCNGSDAQKFVIGQ